MTGAAPGALRNLLVYQPKRGRQARGCCGADSSFVLVLLLVLVLVLETRA